jgi:ketosteroid isomerase-like protein
MDQPAPAAIADARAAFVDAIRVGDIDALADLYDVGARLIVPGAGAPVRGRAEVAAYWRAGIESGVAALTLDPEEVECLPDVACEVGRYALRIAADDGIPVVDRGRYLLVYRFHLGRWTRAAEMFAPDPSAREGS